MLETRRFHDVAVGDELPTHTVPITVQLIAGGAIATRDYFPGHLDADAARALGSPHIFMNILTTNGLVQAYVENWAGPDSVLRNLKIKLGAPNYPGDQMKFSARVSARNEADRSVEIALAGTNSMGKHVSGTVTVRLP